MVRGREKERDATSPNADEALFSEILWAIGKIRSQKQRPGEDQISKVLETRTGRSRKEIVAALETAVRAGRIVKVMTRDRASYKDPRTTPLEKQTTSTGEWLWMVRVALTELEETGSEEPGSGSTLIAIEKCIRKKHGTITADMSEQIRRAVDAGLVKGRIAQDGKFYRTVSMEPVVKATKLKVPKLLKVPWKFFSKN